MRETLVSINAQSCLILWFHLNSICLKLTENYIEIREYILKTIATLVLICVFSNAFSAENNSTSLEKLMQKFEQNKITKVTVLLDQCTIIGKPIPVTTSLYKEVVFYLNLNDLSWIQRNNERYIALNKYLSATNIDGAGEDPYETLSYNAIKLNENSLTLEAILHYSKQEKGNYSSYSQNYKCPINDKKIVTFAKVHD